MHEDLPVSNISRFFVLLIGLLVAICGSAAVVRGADDVVVESPNGDVRLTLRVAGGADAPQFAVTYQGRAVIEPSPVDVQLAEVGSISAEWVRQLPH